MKCRRYWWQFWRQRCKPADDPKPVLPKAEPKPPSEIPKMKLVTEVHGLTNATDAERLKFRKSMEYFELCANSEEFKARVLAERMQEREGYSQLQIYNMFMSGADKFNTEKDSDVDIYVTYYYKNNGTVGYTYPSTWKTWINRKFFRNYDYGNVCGNVCHEYAHNLGFGHTKSNKKSVPYRLGYIMGDLVDEYINEEIDFTPVHAA